MEAAGREGEQPQQFALARLIEDALLHPQSSCVLVAEAGASGKLVGVMALTADDAHVDAPGLAAAYDLSAYDDLVHREPATEAEPEALKSQPPEKAESGEALAEEEEGTAAAGDKEEEEEEAAPEEEEEDAAPEEAAAPAPAPPAKPLAFRVSTLCVDAGYETRTPDFLEYAFEAFPDKDFAILTVSPASPELPLAKLAMTRVAPLHADAVDALYASHRAGTLPGFSIRAAAARDAAEVMELLEGLPEREAMAEAFREAAAAASTGFSAAVVATCEGQVVGYATLTCEVDVAPLAACFALGDNVDLDHHAADGFAKLDECVMNPIFAHKRRLVILEAMRLTKKTCVLYQLAPGAEQPPPPDVVTADFQLVAGRRSHTGFDAHFALFAFTARISSAPRLTVNSRVVVVGSSEAALAAVERLLTFPGCAFNNVTLVAAGGVSVGGPASAYTRASLAKLALESGGGAGGGVAVVDNAMVGLDREARCVYLDDDTVLQYEMLVLASGLQDQTRFRLGASEDLPVERLNDLAANLTQEEAAALGCVIVYGDTLEALGAVRTLLNKGVNPPAIKVVTPPPTGQPGTGMMAVAVAAAGSIGGSHAWHMIAVEGQAKARQGLRLIGAETCEAGVRAYFDGPGVGTATEGEGGQVSLSGAGAEASGAPATETLEADFLVACDEGDVDPTIFGCLNDAGIVYDGAVVVDAAFRTNDPDIYATGSLAKFSRRYGKGRLPLKYHNPREVGVKLADSLIARARGDAPAEVPPSLTQPRAESTVLPGKFQFLYVGTPASCVKPTFEHPPGGRSIVTKDDAFCRLDVDADGLVCGFYYCGDKKVDAARMGAIVGLPLSYLEIDDAYKQKQVDDLLEFLFSDTLSALFHEKFAQRHRSLMALLEGGAEQKHRQHHLLGPATTKGVVQDVVLDFVKQHAHDLPHYAAAEV